VKQFHADHKAKGWGGTGSHFVIADDGALICARLTILKGAHVGMHNTRNLGVNCPGTTGDRPTPQQKETYRGLLANAHTASMPKAHRTDRDLRQARLFGHRAPGPPQQRLPGTDGPGRIRTCDLGIKSPLLCQLSYRPVESM
jgi:hypothetical protein